MTTVEDREGLIVDPDRLEAIREGRRGTILVAYLDISSEAYVAAGEPGDYIVGLGRGGSAMLYGVLTSLLRDGGAVRVEDEAARGIHQFLSAGIDRQAFMAPLMEALSMDTGGGGRVTPSDPMAGYMERAAAAEMAARERREGADK